MLCSTEYTRGAQGKISSHFSIRSRPAICWMSIYSRTTSQYDICIVHKNTYDAYTTSGFKTASCTKVLIVLHTPGIRFGTFSPLCTPSLSGPSWIWPLYTIYFSSTPRRTLYYSIYIICFIYGRLIWNFVSEGALRMLFGICVLMCVGSDIEFIVFNHWWCHEKGE